MFWALPVFWGFGAASLGLGLRRLFLVELLVGFRRRDRSVRLDGLGLIVKLVVVAVLSLVAMTFAELMRSEYQATRLHGRQVQARVATDSGIDMLLAFLAQEEELITEAGGIYDNPAAFQRGRVYSENWIDVEDGRQRCNFSILAPLVVDGRIDGVRFGLEDESARVNLNTLLVADAGAEDGGRRVLLALPGMTEEIADAILDWIDPDDEPREFGAEVDYYSGLNPPYAPKNGPLETIEELLLVRGVSPELLLGADWNYNHTLELKEQEFSATVGGVDNSDGALNHGWAAYLTLYSTERNLRPDGTAKIDVNSEDLEQLYADLEEALGGEMATFIIAYRQSGPYEITAERGERIGNRKLDLKRPGPVPLQTVLDLIGPNVRASFPGADGQQQRVVLQTPFPDSPIAMRFYLPLLMDHLAVNPMSARDGRHRFYLPLLMDHLAVNPMPTIPGRININQAPRTVLLGIPGLEPETVDEIISVRFAEVTDEQPERRHETWLLSEGIVDLEQMKEMMPFVTGGGRVYRAQIVGYFDEGGPSFRIETVIDATSGDPRVVFWRDISHLGRGYPLSALGVTE
ncbi:MAG: general secretion pathway protein GspK [Chloroflexi bacterium]|nr:general secretion pathway protein GspK [Chloroflexota bacterium]